MVEKRIIQVFSDESGYDGDNRFASLAKVVGEKENQKMLHDELEGLLKKYSVSEMKFTHVNGYNKLCLAKEFIDVCIKYVLTMRIKVSVLIWDKHDSRHSISKRCDISNLCRMYYHHLRDLKREWKVPAEWQFFPDEFSAIDWKSDIVDFLTKRSLNKVIPIEPDMFQFYQNITVDYTKVTPLKSVKFPIIQLADLFAGVCRMSRQEVGRYNYWLSLSNGQIPMFRETAKIEVSKSLDWKFKLKKYLKERSDALRLGINLSDAGYLKTLNRSARINIWHYTPQSYLDKAPTK